MTNKSLRIAVQGVYNKSVARLFLQDKLKHSDKLGHATQDSKVENLCALRPPRLPLFFSPFALRN